MKGIGHQEQNFGHASYWDGGMATAELKNEDLCELVKGSRSEAYRKIEKAEEVKKEQDKGSVHGSCLRRRW